MKRLTLVWLACGLVAHLSAQEPAPTPTPKLPSGPLLNRAPDFSQWTITNKDAADALETEAPEAEPKAEPSPLPSPTATPHRHQRAGDTSSKKPAAVEATETSAKKPAAPAESTTVVTKTLGLRCEETNQGTGVKIQKWCLPDMQVTITGESTPVVSMPGATAQSGFVDYSKTDFPGFEWIAESNFTGVKTVMGQECLIFENRLALKKKDGPAPAVPPGAVASINSATRLPVALQTEGELLTYKFELAPTAMLTLPPEVGALVEQWRKTMEQSALRPAKP